MAGEEGGAAAEAEETNYYLLTLRRCRDTLIPNAAHAVYAGQGDPGSGIASSINGGGWDCDEGTKWTADLLEHTKRVLPAFDDAVADVSAAISAEQSAHGGKDTVPKDHPHGIAWNRTWSIQQHNL
jgi:hypothetical protein